MPAVTLTPIQFQRQYAGPLDPDAVFASTAARLAFLTSARRFPGMQVADLEEQQTYMLNAAGDGWLRTSNRVNPYDIPFSVYGDVAANTMVGFQAFSRHIVINPDFLGSVAKCITAPTVGPSVLNLTHSIDGLIGTITFAQGSTTGVYAATTPETYMPLPVASTLTLATHASTWDDTIQTISLVINGNAIAQDLNAQLESSFPALPVAGVSSPVVVTRANTTKVFGTSLGVTLPSGLTAGDLILVIGAEQGNQTSTASGYSVIYQSAGPGSNMTVSILGRIATGADTCTINGTTGWRTATAFRITGCSSLAKVYATSTNNHASTLVVDPPNLNPGVGPKNWLAIAGVIHYGLMTPSVYPSGYGTGRTGGPTGQDIEITWSTAEKTLTAVASEDPNTFTFTSSGGILPHPFTIMLRG